MAYVSNVLTHWVGRGKTEDEQYAILTENILKNKELLYGTCPWHFVSRYGGVKNFTITMISYTDIPFSECSQHCDKYSHFGLSFDIHYLANCLASPVGYIQHPFIHQNYSYIYHTLSGIKNVVNGIEIPEGKRKGKKFDARQLLSRFQFMMCYFEDYSTDEFKYNEAAVEPIPGQENYFTDTSALYYEREWRMVLSNTAKDLPWNVSHDGKTYFKFNEHFLKWIIVPQAYVHRLQEVQETIFSDYELRYIPKIVAYEDLKYF